MNYTVIKLTPKRTYEIGTSFDFEWKETVVPTKAQIIQKAIQHLVYKGYPGGKYVVFYGEEDLEFEFYRRVKQI